MAKHVHKWLKQPMEDWVCSRMVEHEWCGGVVAYVCAYSSCNDCRCAKHAPRPAKPAKPSARWSTSAAPWHLRHITFDGKVVRYSTVAKLLNKLKARP